MKILLKDLIELDFFLVKEKSSSSYNINSAKIINCLKLTRDLKQFVKNLHLVKKNKNLKITFFCNDKFSLNLLSFLISKFDDNSIFTLTSDVTEVENSSILLIFGENGKFLNRKFLNNLIDNNTFLISNFRLNSEDDYGFYEFSNDFYDYKKLIVILVLIQKVLNS